MPEMESAMFAVEARPHLPLAAREMITSLLAKTRWGGGNQVGEQKTKDFLCYCATVINLELF